MFGVHVAIQSNSVLFAVIVSICVRTSKTCAGNDTITTMTTKRPTRAHHASPHSTQVRHTARHTSTQTTPRKRSAHVRSSAQTHATTKPSGGITRRHFIYGAVGAGALAAVGASTALVLAKKDEAPADDITVLEVPTDNVTASDSLSLVEDATTLMACTGSYTLPYGSLVWSNSDDIAVCLTPTEQANPLTQVAILSLATGATTTVLEKAEGHGEGFDIFDVRASSSGVIWVEADIMDNMWRVYTATLEGGAETPSLTNINCVAEGDTIDWETPSLAAVGGWAFWQVMPTAEGNARTEDSLLMRAAFGQEDSQVVYTSHGRMSTPVYAQTDAVVISPRAEASGVYYQLTCLDASSGDIRDTLVLPLNMKPLEAAYGETGFSFSFDAWYNYGDGIAGIGTYVPASPVLDGTYSDQLWFCFDRTPTAAPAWCGPYFMVKSTTAVCGVNVESGEYFAFEVESGSDTYGDYLATSGTHTNVVTFANVDDTPLEGDPIHCCTVRVWTPIA